MNKKRRILKDCPMKIFLILIKRKIVMIMLEVLIYIQRIWTKIFNIARFNSFK